MTRFLFPFLAFALGTAALAAPPDVPEVIVADPGDLTRVVVKVPKGKDGKPAPIEHFRNFKDGDAFWGQLVSASPDEMHFVYQAPKKKPAKGGARSADGSVTVNHTIGFINRDAGESGGSMTTISVTYPPDVIVPVVPPTPKPTDPVTPPAPVTSFRVVLIYESADTLTAAQRAVVYGKPVEDWMTANCTGGKAGWRRRDKDSPGDADPTMAALWAAIQPKVTTTPCAAVEVNGKVELIPLDATPAAMVATLTSYRGK